MLKNYKEEYSNLKDRIQYLKGKTLIFAHYDLDGITSAIVFSKILEKHNLKYKKDYFLKFGRDSEHSISENKELVQELLDYDNIILLDFSLTDYSLLKNKNILGIDHHNVDCKEFLFNPSKELSAKELPSASALVYDFYYFLYGENKNMKKIAALGAISDFMIYGSLPFLHTNTEDSDLFMNNSQLIKPILLEITQRFEELYSSKGFEIKIFENIKNKGIDGLFYFTNKEINKIKEVIEKELSLTYDYLSKAKIYEDKKLIILELDYKDKNLKKHILNVLEFTHSRYTKIVYIKRKDFSSFSLRSPNKDLTKILNEIKKIMPSLNGGGHKFAAGCAINKNKTEKFLETLIKEL